MHPLSRFAPSPSLAAREGNDAIAAGRPLLGVLWTKPRRFHRAPEVGSAMDNAKEPCHV